MILIDHSASGGCIMDHGSEEGHTTHEVEEAQEGVVGRIHRTRRRNRCEMGRDMIHTRYHTVVQL